MSPVLHVVGAGLAGLAAAVAGLRGGWRVALHEAAPQAGGRCRSFHDPVLDRVIDNGTHLVLGCNRQALAFAAAIGGHEALKPGQPFFPFHDLAGGRGWRVGPGELSAGLLEVASALGLPFVAERETVAARLGPARSYRSLWQPLCVAALNTDPTDASARLFARLLRAILLGGKDAMRPYLFPTGLSSVFAAPALATLAVHGARAHFRRRLTMIETGRLVFDSAEERLDPADRVVLALPPWALEGVAGPVPALATRAIVNVHYRLGRAAILPGGQPFLALVGGTAQWLAAREDVVSVTVSSADRLAERDPAEIADLVWREVAPLLGEAPNRPAPARVIKERRATLAHTPDTLRRRQWNPSAPSFVSLAGDWTCGRWPCTIEAAVESGLEAARRAMGQPKLSFAG